ncbi:MAG TPA: glycosyltransferase family 4 protein, partial [Candidatus Caenarcaniphilales bacterium]
FDIIHAHIGYVALPFATLVKIPTIHTLHLPFSLDSRHLFAYHRQQPFISISNAQREAELGLNYIRTVYNGINLDDYPFQAQPQDPPYLAFLGRMSPEKGPHYAIQIAKETGWPLKMAGKLDAVHQQFFEQAIAPQIDGKHIQYLGEADHDTKVDLLSHAAVTLFPINWREPFGLVMIESMGTGTPVIGIGMGSVPEVIAHGKTGFICQHVEEMSDLIPRAVELDRHACRKHVYNHFSIPRMVDNYEAAYQQVLEAQAGNNELVRSTNL